MFVLTPVEGRIILDLTLIPGRGNVISALLTFEQPNFNRHARAEGDNANFQPPFNLGDHYQGAAYITSRFDFALPLPLSCTLTVLEQDLTIQFFANNQSTDLIGYASSNAAFLETEESNVPLPWVTSTRMNILWTENYRE